VQFSVVCFFESGKRWQKVKTPSSGSYISVTGKIVGRMAETNKFVFRVLDLAYLLRSSSTAVTPGSALTPTSKRFNRWDGRLDSSTPLKMRKLDTGSRSADGSEENMTIIADTAPHIPLAVENDVNLQLPAAIIEYANGIHSVSHGFSSPTAVDPDESSVSSIPSQLSDSGSRARRNRHAPKVFQL
jgi:hypothetical protein